MAEPKIEAGINGQSAAFVVEVLEKRLLDPVIGWMS